MTEFNNEIYEKAKAILDLKDRKENYLKICRKATICPDCGKLLSNPTELDDNSWIYKIWECQCGYQYKEFLYSKLAYV